MKKHRIDEPRERRATPEQRKIRKWFLGLDVEDSARLVAQTRGMQPDQAAAFFRTKYYEAQENAT